MKMPIVFYGLGLNVAPRTASIVTSILHLVASRLAVMTFFGFPGQGYGKYSNSGFERSDDSTACASSGLPVRCRSGCGRLPGFDNQAADFFRRLDGFFPKGVVESGIPIGPGPSHGIPTAMGHRCRRCRGDRGLGKWGPGSLAGRLGPVRGIGAIENCGLAPARNHDSGPKDSGFRNGAGLGGLPSLQIPSIRFQPSGFRNR